MNFHHFLGIDFSIDFLMKNWSKMTFKVNPGATPSAPKGLPGDRGGSEGERPGADLFSAIDLSMHFGGLLVPF